MNFYVYILIVLYLWGTFDWQCRFSFQFNSKHFEIGSKRLLFKKANPGHFFVYFRSFHIPIQMTDIKFALYKLKKA